MAQLNKDQGQMSLADGSVNQVDAGKFESAINAHLKSIGGTTIGKPQTSISRPFQPASVIGGNGVNGK
jgi:hypothetical protein